MTLTSEVIPSSRQNPNVLVCYGLEVIRDGVAELFPFPWDGFPKELQDCVRELLVCGVVAVMGNV